MLISTRLKVVSNKSSRRVDEEAIVDETLEKEQCMYTSWDDPPKDSS